MAYQQGTVSVGTTATKICTPPVETGGVVVQNQGTGAVFLGGSTVTATGATAGISLAANASITLPTVGSGDDTLYGIVATATSNVAFLYVA